VNASSSQIATLGGWGPQKIERFERTVSEPFIIRAGSGGAIGLGKQLKDGRRAIDQDGIDGAQVEGYGNAGHAPSNRSVQEKPKDDERMPDEWNRANNKEGYVAGFIGHRPIIRGATDKQVVPEIAEHGGDSENTTESGVMAALARLRQEED
jgi:hypothetical protein